jgi:hypothetical protein
MLFLVDQMFKQQGKEFTISFGQAIPAQALGGREQRVMGPKNPPAGIHLRKGDPSCLGLSGLSGSFWPFWLFYIPVYIFIFIRGFIRRSLTFFLSANPGLPYGGFVEYPKDHLLKLMPEENVPVTRTLPAQVGVVGVLKAMEESGLNFPVILKPNMGERGFGVEKIYNKQALAEYLKGAQGTILLQEYVSTLMEYGVMVAPVSR